MPPVAKPKKPRGKWGGARPNSGPKPRLPYTPEQYEQMQSAARQYTADAIRVLAEIMLDDKIAAQLRQSSANSLLDRGWGKAAQSVTVAGDADNPLKFAIQGVIMSLDAKLERVAAPDSAPVLIEGKSKS